MAKKQSITKPAVKETPINAEFLADILTKTCPQNPGYLHGFRHVGVNLVMCSGCGLEINLGRQKPKVNKLSKEETSIRLRKANSICLQTMLRMLTDPCSQNPNQEGDHPAHHCFHNNDDGDAAVTCCWCGFTVYDGGSMWMHTRRELKEPAGASKWIN